MRTEKRSKMKRYTLTGILFIVIGIFAFAYQGITSTPRDKVMKSGPIDMTADKTKTLQLPPVLVGIVLAGVVLLLDMVNKKGRQETKR